jgi:hypothetical protein
VIGADQVLSYPHSHPSIEQLQSFFDASGAQVF